MQRKYVFVLIFQISQTSLSQTGWGKEKQCQFCSLKIIL